jgi:hypothetical protein
MPLKRGSSQATIGENIRELHSGDTYAATRAKHGADVANKQAIAIAFSQARKSSGGKIGVARSRKTPGVQKG